MTQSSDENKVVVRIFGEDYPIAGPGDPAYISRIADLVDARMHELSQRSHTKAREKVAILTALSFASELQERTGEVTGLSQRHDIVVQQMLSQLDRVLADESPGQG